MFWKGCPAFVSWKSRTRWYAVLRRWCMTYLCQHETERKTDYPPFFCFWMFVARIKFRLNQFQNLLAIWFQKASLRAEMVRIRNVAQARDGFWDNDRDRLLDLEGPIESFQILLANICIACSFPWSSRKWSLRGPTASCVTARVLWESSSMKSCTGPPAACNSRYALMFTGTGTILRVAVYFHQS